MVWSYYSPALNMQLWLWPLIAAGIYLLGMLTAISPVSPVSSFAVSGIYMLIGFGPLMMVRCSSLVTETMMPARADEKFVFYLIYFLLVVPAITLLAVGVLHALSVMLLGAERLHEYTYVLMQRFQMLRYTYGAGAFGDVIGIIACIYGVTAFTRNRALAGVGLSIGSGVAIGIVSGIFGIIYGFATGFADGFSEVDKLSMLDSSDTEVVMNAVYEMPFMRVLTIFVSCVALIGSVVFGYLLLRSINRRQL